MTLPHIIGGLLAALAALVMLAVIYAASLDDGPGGRTQWR